MDNLHYSDILTLAFCAHCFSTPFYVVKSGLYVTISLKLENHKYPLAKYVVFSFFEDAVGS